MFLLNTCIPVSTEDVPMAGVLRMSISRQRSTADLSPWASLSPSTVNLAIWINSHCPDRAQAQQFHVQEEPFLSLSQAILLTKSSPLGNYRSSDIVEWTLCTINPSIFPAMHIRVPEYSWICLLHAVALVKSSFLTCPLLCPTPVQDDASESITKATPRRWSFQKTSRTFIVTILLLKPIGH